jgi:hypothetical protein
MLDSYKQSNALLYSIQTGKFLSGEQVSAFEDEPYNIALNYFCYKNVTINICHKGLHMFMPLAI